MIKFIHLFPPNKHLKIGQYSNDSNDKLNLPLIGFRDFFPYLTFFDKC